MALQKVHRSIEKGCAGDGTIGQGSVRKCRCRQVIEEALLAFRQEPRPSETLSVGSW